MTLLITPFRTYKEVTGGQFEGISVLQVKESVLKVLPKGLTRKSWTRLLVTSKGIVQEFDCRHTYNVVEERLH